MLDSRLVSIFDARELELVIAGTVDIYYESLFQVLDSRLVSIFDARELELVIAGTVNIYY